MVYSAPASSHSPLVLIAPAAGQLIDLAQVPDSVFAQGLLGPGCGLYPFQDTLAAPCNGVILKAMDHALLIAAENGVQLLMHAGIDTVALGGKGCRALVDSGAPVKAGQPVLAMDRAFLASQNICDCLILTASDAPDPLALEFLCAPDSLVQAGQPLLTLQI